MHFEESATVPNVDDGQLEKLQVTAGQSVASSKKSLNHYIRRLFPSTSRITFHPIFKAIVNSSDLAWQLIWPEFRRIPPNHMRIRVGVGNRLFNNQVAYLQSGGPQWLFAFSRGYADFNSTILDIGCGNGRETHVLRDLQFHGFRFTGSYVGIDIDREMVDYCRSTFDKERFRFHVATDASASYNNKSHSDGPYRIPEPDGTVDYVTSGSVLTHLLEREVENYITESFRLLRVGGHAAHSFYSMDHPPPTFGDRHTFSHRVGNAHVESLAQPEAAVAYRESFLHEIATRVGFSQIEFLVTPQDSQQLMVCKKGRAAELSGTPPSQAS